MRRCVYYYRTLDKDRNNGGRRVTRPRRIWNYYYHHRRHDRRYNSTGRSFTRDKTGNYTESR